LTKILLWLIKRLSELEVPVSNMQKKVFAVAFSFLLLTLSTLMFMPRAEANFVSPPANPEIHFLTPVNTTYSSNNISVEVGFETYRTHYHGGPTLELSRQFQYSLDGTDYQRVRITNSSIGQQPGSNVWFEGFIQLHNLTEGWHNLTVKVVFNYSEPAYPPSQRYDIHTETVSNAYFVIDSSNDSLHNTSEAPVNYPIIVLVVAVALVSSVSAFAYRRQKTNHKLNCMKLNRI
jgi:hypothetical protein